METPFIKKVKKILQDPANENIIGWSNNKTMIEIRNQKLFEQTVLTRNFRHSKISSFIRQLNLYGFKKIRSMEFRTFTHPVLEKGLGFEAITNKRKRSEKSEEGTLDQDSVQSQEHNVKHSKDNSAFTRKQSDGQNHHILSTDFERKNIYGNKQKVQTGFSRANNDVMNVMWILPSQQITWPMFSSNFSQNCFVNMNSQPFNSVCLEGNGCF